MSRELPALTDLQLRRFALFLSLQLWHNLYPDLFCPDHVLPDWLGAEAETESVMQRLATALGYYCNRHGGVFENDGVHGPIAGRGQRYYVCASYDPVLPGETKSGLLLPLAAALPSASPVFAEAIGGRLNDGWYVVETYLNLVTSGELPVNCLTAIRPEFPDG